MAPEEAMETPRGDTKDWRRWCRLCAKYDPKGNRSVFETKSNNVFDTTLATAIGKYFYVNIKIDDHLSRDLCIQCHTLMTKLIAFSERVNKVQAVFFVLENVAQTATIDSYNVRKQYGILDDNWEHIIKMDKQRSFCSEDTTELNNECLDHATEEQIVETLEYEDEKDETKDKIIKKETESMCLEDDEILGEYEEELQESNNNEMKKAYMDDPKNDQVDFDEFDYADVNDTEFEVEFMNDMEGNHDGESDETETDHKKLKEYKCGLCPKIYRNHASYRRHVQHTHTPHKYGENYTRIESPESIEDNNETSLPHDYQRTDVDSSEETADESKALNNDDTNSEITDTKEDIEDKISITRNKRSSNSPQYASSIKRSKVDSSEDSSGGGGSLNSIARYHCEICNRPYKSPGCYRRHMLENHQIEADIIALPCDFCEETFLTEKQLAAHRRRHLPCSEKQDYGCNYCDKRFTTSGALRQHINGIHFNEKPYICDECGKSMKTLAALNEHKLVHTDDKPVECEICGKGFKNKARMKVHMDTHASTGYQCNICGHNLNTRRTLRTHMLVHSDEKQYKCSFCPTEFKRSKALKNHLILHTGMRPFKCPYCDRTFSNGSNCRSHKKKVHPVELAEDEAKGIKRHEQDYVPNLNQLRAGAHIQSVKKVSRNRTGGLTPRMRALLIAAEKRGENISEYTLQREDSDTLDTLESYAVEEEFDAFDVNEQEVQAEVDENAVAVQAVSVSHNEDNEETIIYEVLDGI